MTEGEKMGDLIRRFFLWLLVKTGRHEKLVAKLHLSLLSSLFDREIEIHKITGSRVTKVKPLNRFEKWLLKPFLEMAEREDLEEPDDVPVNTSGGNAYVRVNGAAVDSEDDS